MVVFNRNGLEYILERVKTRRKLKVKHYKGFKFKSEGIKIYYLI